MKSKNLFLPFSIVLLSNCAVASSTYEAKRTKEQQTVCRNISNTYKVAKTKAKTLSDISLDMLNNISDASVKQGIITKEQYKEELKENIRDSKNKKFHYKMYTEALTCIKEINPKTQKEIFNNVKEFIDLTYNTYAPAEQKKLTEKTESKQVCDTLDNYMENVWVQLTPRKDCLYTIQELNLKVQQATKKGLLVNSTLSPYMDTSRMIYLFRDNNKESNLVDGSRVEPGTFEYKGIFTYQSLTGERSIYSFKRLNMDYPSKDILFYQRDHTSQ